MVRGVRVRGTHYTVLAVLECLSRADWLAKRKSPSAFNGTRDPSGEASCVKRLEGREKAQISCIESSRLRTLQLEKESVVFGGKRDLTCCGLPRVS